MKLKAINLLYEYMVILSAEIQEKIQINWQACDFFYLNFSWLLFFFMNLALTSLLDNQNLSLLGWLNGQSWHLSLVLCVQISNTWRSFHCGPMTGPECQSCSNHLIRQQLTERKKVAKKFTWLHYLAFNHVSRSIWINSLAIIGNKFNQ